MASFEVKGDRVENRYPDGNIISQTVAGTGHVTRLLDDFKNCFQPDENPSKYANCGLFGYMAYDAIRFFEDVPITQRESQIPDILYKLYRYVIIIDHFSNELSLFEFCWEGSPACKSTLERVEQ